MDALCRLDYQAASQYCTWKLLETTWKCFVSFWMASAIESLSLLSSLSRCNQNWTHTIMHHAFKTWCIVSTNGRYAKSVTVVDTISTTVIFCLFPFWGFFRHETGDISNISGHKQIVCPDLMRPWSEKTGLGKIAIVIIIETINYYFLYIYETVHGWE